MKSILNFNPSTEENPPLGKPRHNRHMVRNLSDGPLCSFNMEHNPHIYSTIHPTGLFPQVFGYGDPRFPRGRNEFDQQLRVEARHRERLLREYTEDREKVFLVNAVSDMQADGSALVKLAVPAEAAPTSTAVAAPLSNFRGILSSTGSYTTARPNTVSPHRPRSTRPTASHQRSACILPSQKQSQFQDTPWTTTRNFSTPQFQSSSRGNRHSKRSSQTSAAASLSAHPGSSATISRVSFRKHDGLMLQPASFAPATAPLTITKLESRAESFNTESYTRVSQMPGLTAPRQKIAMLIGVADNASTAATALPPRHPASGRSNSRRPRSSCYPHDGDCTTAVSGSAAIHSLVGSSVLTPATAPLVTQHQSITERPSLSAHLVSTETDVCAAVLQSGLRPDSAAFGRGGRPRSVTIESEAPPVFTAATQSDCEVYYDFNMLHLATPSIVAVENSGEDRLEVLSRGHGSPRSLTAPSRPESGSGCRHYAQASPIRTDTPECHGGSRVNYSAGSQRSANSDERLACLARAASIFASTTN